MQPIVLREIVEALSVIIDLMSPVLANHQLRVAHISNRIGEAAGMVGATRHEMLLAALLHDCGALSNAERKEIKRFEFDLDRDKARQHAEAGYRLLRDFGPFAGMADVVRHHHRHWVDGKGRTASGETVPLGAQIIHLADRIDVLLDSRQDFLAQAEAVKERIRAGSGSLFDPGLVDLFLDLAAKEYFWFDLETVAHRAAIECDSGLPAIGIEIADLPDLAGLFSQLIDFRSRFTATHSHGVAVCAGKLAELSGMKTQDRKMLEAAGHLHDLGKLAVPREVIEKKGPLTRPETSLLKRHSYFTYWVLRRINGLETITEWAACHHERLNGKGYPFHYEGEQLSPGARIIAVADVFTAVTEDRPYRAGMAASSVIKLLARMGGGGVLDGDIIHLLLENFGDINRERAAAQGAAMRSYERFCMRDASHPGP